MEICPACHCALDLHSDRECIASLRRQAEVARVILRSLLAVPYREFATSRGATMVAVAMTYEQYQALRRFAEGE